MEEQSHKDEMRAALRGDFERLQARRETGAGADDERNLPRDTGPSAGGPDIEPQESWLARLLGRA